MAPALDELAQAKAEATFWQRKYFEQLLHSTQVITALSRPMLGQARMEQDAAAAAANGAIHA